MLSTEDIEKLLGAKTVKAIEKAVAKGFDAAERSAQPAEGIEAVRYLLLSLLAASTITPFDNAGQRAEQLAADLVELVAIALQESTDEPPQRLS